MDLCSQCPRACKADRAGESLGVCGVSWTPKLARIALHFDEEPCISGENGSGAVFFSGCPLRCAFCQNDKISHACFGRELRVPELRRAIDRLIARGAENINLVSPTQYAHIMPELLADLPVPVVWNSSGYESVATLRRMEGLVGIYLPDLKYMSGESARKYSGAADYPAIAQAAILEMYRQVGSPKLDDRGMMRSGLMIRHLILPGHTRESKEALRWIKENVPDAWVSLMAQYMPCARADRYPEINRRLTQAEYDSVVDTLFALDLTQGYVQELSSSDETYVPAFDLTGVE